MKKNYPEIACWRITSKCNRKCDFCFRPNRPDIKTKEAFKIIDNITAHGLKGIGITGGEPLLREDILRILEYFWTKGIKICLATNTDLYQKYRRQINKFVSTIGIPIESSTEKIHDLIRGEGNFQNVRKAINDIYKKRKIWMYFSTVVTKKNINELTNIERFLAKYKNRILYWKIYSVINYPDRASQIIRNSKVSEEKIKKIISSLGKELGPNKIFYLSPNDRSEASFLINSDGEASVPINKKTMTKDVILGNLLKSRADKIFANWTETADLKKYKCHKCALKCVSS